METLELAEVKVDRVKRDCRLRGKKCCFGLELGSDSGFPAGESLFAGQRRACYRESENEMSKMFFTFTDCSRCASNGVGNDKSMKVAPRGGNKGVSLALVPKAGPCLR